MMPEFAALLTSVYPALRTSARVAAEHRVSPPPGCATSMFFWDTGKACGEASSEGGSTENPGEACAVVAIAVHLIRSGVAPDHITVLAPYALQVARITRLLALEVPKVAESGWPSEQRHGKAADLQAGALMDRHAAGRALPNDPQLCLATAETLLKLGRTPPTARLLKHATGLQQVREPAPAGDAARRDGARAAQLAALVVRVEAQVAAVDAFWDGCAAQALQHPGEAINALKRLEGFAVEWKTQGFISAAAAACHARIVMAKRIAAAPAQLSEGMKGLLDVLRKKAEQLLADFATSEGAVHVSSIDRFQGSENDVVLVSLTRSNARGQVGFLKEQARLVVAQSRARLGMYFIGDRATYDTVKHWRAFSAAMHARECAGAKIPLACP
ncbi:AAA domain-containing protein, partial [Baffinella frigidus]